jgi:hypothetical protein
MEASRILGHSPLLSVSTAPVRPTPQAAMIARMTVTTSKGVAVATAAAGGGGWGGGVLVSCGDGGGGAGGLVGGFRARAEQAGDRDRVFRRRHGAGVENHSNFGGDDADAGGFVDGEFLRGQNGDNCYRCNNGSEELAERDAQ